MTEPTRAERIRLIEKALRDCGQPVTREAVAKQYRYETGRELDPPQEEGPWERW